MSAILRQQTCWDDGRGGKNVSNALRQATVRQGNGAWGNNGSQPIRAQGASVRLRRGQPCLFRRAPARLQSGGENVQWDRLQRGAQCMDGDTASQPGLTAGDAGRQHVLRPARSAPQRGRWLRWDDLQLSTRESKLGETRGPQGSASDFQPNQHFLQGRLQQTCFVDADSSCNQRRNSGRLRRHVA